MKVLNMIFMSVTAFSLAACSVSSDSDEVLTENLNQYTGIYEGYALNIWVIPSFFQIVLLWTEFGWMILGYFGVRF
jgi:hypothetical protein